MRLSSHCVTEAAGKVTREPISVLGEDRDGIFQLMSCMLAATRYLLVWYGRPGGCRRPC